jgi:lysozyme family protein
MAREIPSYVSQLSTGGAAQVQFTSAQANATNKVSAELSTMASDIQRKNNEIEELTATTTLSEELHRISREAGSDVGKLQANLDAFKKTFIPNIKNADLQKKLDITFNSQARPFLDKAMGQYSKNVEQAHELSMLQAVKQGRVDIATAANGLFDPTPEVKQASAAAIKDNVERIAAIASAKKSDGSFYFSPEQQMKMVADAKKDTLTALPPDKRIEMLGGAAGGFENVMAGVFKHEGGYTDSDGNTGNPANFGINQKFHPDVDVKSLTKEQAAAIYKRDYWDAYKIGELPANVQGIVMDGVVNHHSGFKDKMVAAARAGASAGELIDMRQKEYDRLAATGKYSKAIVSSWNNRLSSYEHLAQADEVRSSFAPEEQEKLLTEAVSEFKSQEERANILRVVGGAAKDKDIYAKFVANSPNILQDIEEYKTNGGDPELANYMRTSALTRNKLSAGEQDQIQSEIFDDIGQLDISNSEKTGKVKIGNKDAKLEDLIRLQRKVMAASVQGVPYLDSQLRKLSPAILELSKKESGHDDAGLLWADPDEPLDNGYGAIQKFLEKQGKEKDYALKARMYGDFIDKADQLPADIRKDKALFEQAQVQIAQSVIASAASKGMKNIPLPAITRLIANPTEAAQFDELFGAGASAKVLGKQ